MKTPQLTCCEAERKKSRADTFRLIHSRREAQRLLRCAYILVRASHDCGVSFSESQKSRLKELTG